MTKEAPNLKQYVNDDKALKFMTRDQVLNTISRFKGLKDLFANNDTDLLKESTKLATEFGKDGEKKINNENTSRKQKTVCSF